MSDASRADQLLARFEKRHGQDALRLAELASLAVQIDAPLLRHLRRTFLPGADPGIEADVWFSSLVESHDATSCVLHNDIALRLRARIPTNLVSQAIAITRQAHLHWPAAVQLEEELTGLAYDPKTDDERLALAVKPALDALADTDERRALEVARWALQAERRFHNRLRGARAIQLLLTAAALRLQRQRLPEAARDAALSASEVAWLAPLPSGNDVEFGVVLYEDRLRFVSPEESKNHVALPPTSPLLASVAWTSGKETHERLIEVRQGTEVDGLAGADKIELTMLSGARYALSRIAEEAVLAKQGRLIDVPEPDKDELASITGLTFLPGNTSFVATTAGGTVRIYRLPDGHLELAGGLLAGGLLDEFETHSDPKRLLALSPHGDRVVSVTAHGALKVWHPRNPQLDYEISSKWGPFVRVAADLSYIVAYSSGGLLQVFSGNGGKHLFASEFSIEPPASLFLFGGDQVAWITSDGAVEVWEYASSSPTPIATPKSWGSNDGATTLASPDGYKLFIAHGDTISAHDARGLPSHDEHIEVGQHVTALATPTHGNFLLAGCDNGAIEHWAQGPASSIQTSLGTHHAAIQAIAVSSQGNRALTGDRSGIVKLWDLHALREIAIYGARQSTFPFTTTGMVANWTNFTGTVEDVQIPVYATPASFVQGDRVAPSLFSRHGAALKAVIKQCLDTSTSLRTVGAAQSSSVTLESGDTVLDLANLNESFVLRKEWLTEQYVAEGRSGHAPVYVQGGANLGRLHAELRESALALQVAPGSDGGRIAGCIATGTHGSMLNVGAMHDTVLGVHIQVDAEKSLLIQPHSSPACKVEVAHWLQRELGTMTELVRDDELFAAVQVGVGSLGVVAGVVIEAEPLYSLHGKRLVLPFFHKDLWRTIHDLDTRRLDTSAEVPPDHFDVVFHPYATTERPGAFVTLLWKTRHMDFNDTRAQAVEPMGVAATLGDLAVNRTDAIAARLSEVLEQQYQPGPLGPDPIGTMFGPTSVSPGVTTCTEVVVAQRDSRRALELLFELLRYRANFGEHLLGPVGVRFARGSNALLGMNIHPMNCFIELPSQRTEAARAIYREFWRILEKDDIAYTSHWGHVHELTPSVLRRYYGERIDRWKAARRQLLALPIARRVFASPLARAVLD